MIGSPFKPIYLTDAEDRADALRLADVALAASGTVALELALAGLPSVIAYRVNPFTAFLARKMVRAPYMNLVNILLQNEIVPEFFQEQATPQKLADALMLCLSNDNMRQRQISAGQQVQDMLRPISGDSPAMAAAQIILRHI